MKKISEDRLEAWKKFYCKISPSSIDALQGLLKNN